jgi:NAD(P)-dependent dehydrogenase (short-subunit alcohol dehydrogenase family)
MLNLSGKTAVITGSTRGFGLAIARAFVDAGANVVISSRHQNAVEKALAQLNHPQHSQGSACDVADLEQVHALAKLAINTFGGFDVWVNNAGYAGPYGPTSGVRPEMFHNVIRTNITGSYNGTKVALDHFLERGSGKLINILGHGYNGPVPFQSAYAASKAWLRAFSLAVAKENPGSGVGVFIFNPGMMLTELLTDVEVVAGSEERLKVFPTIIRMWARPPEIAAQKVVWIASSETDGQTGKLYNLHSTAHTLTGTLREGWRRLTKQAKPLELTIHTIPYDGKE